MLWGRHASIGHAHVDGSRQECVCAMRKDGQTLLSPAQNTQNVQRCVGVCDGHMVAIVAVVAIAACEADAQPDGWHAGRHIRWRVVTGRRVDRCASCTDKVDIPALMASVCHVGGWAVKQSSGKAGATQADGWTVEMQGEGVKRVGEWARTYQSFAKAESSSSLEDLRGIPLTMCTADKHVGGVLGLL
ncbi:hypothetical protein BC827DRAFT_1159823 [Russula dissimulans]|nr:hypothetical protein BC827DRAFT_1159823 [Russula dissimulans]